MSVSDADFQRWLERSGKHRCVLIELTFLGTAVGSPSGSAEYHAYVSNMAYVTRSTDTPAHQTFDQCVIEAPSFTRRMGEQLEGRSSQSAGDLILSNEYTLDDDGQVLNAGVRDEWLSMNWDGRQVRMWLGDPAWAFADFRLILDGRIVDVFDPGGYKLGFKIGDKAALLDRPVMTTVLGGTGPQAGELMPLALGSNLPNITPLLIDPLTHQYRFTQSGGGEVPYTDSLTVPENPVDVREDGVSLSGNAGPLESSDSGADTLHLTAHGFVEDTRFQFLTGTGTPPAPFSSGVSYWVIASGLTADDFKASATKGGSAVNISGAQVGSPEIFYYGWTADGDGTFTLAGNPNGLITCDVAGLAAVGSPTARVRKAGEVIEQVLTSSLTNTPLTSADIDPVSLAAFNALCDQDVAVFLTAQTTFSALLDRLVLSVGAWWGFSRAGLLQFGRLDLPNPGSPPAVDYSFIADDTARRTMRQQRRILPRAEVKIRGIANWTPQSTIAGSVDEFFRARYATEFSEVTGSATVTTWDTDPANHLNAARPEPFDTLLDVSFTADMQAEADRLATLFQYPTVVETFQTHHAVYLLELGSQIEIDHPRYSGYGVVVGMTERIKGRSEVLYFRQAPDVYPTADIV